MNVQEFPLTPEGYQQAMQWMKDEGLDPVEHANRELSTDGYTIVNLVNHLRQRKVAQTT